MKPPRPILRYPGGKSRARKIIRSYLPDHLSAIVSPFLGGGSVELLLASEGVRVHAYDNFPPLVNFWQRALEDPGRIADIIEPQWSPPLPEGQFYKLQRRLRDGIEDPWKQAAVFFVLNRASFSGATLSGGEGGRSRTATRYTQASIDRLRSFHAPNLRVGLADFRESLGRHPRLFAFLDPPYALDGEAASLYGVRGDQHRGFPHHNLADLLRGRSAGWLLTYNQSLVVSNLYLDNLQIPVRWNYGMNQSKRSSEVIILGGDIKKKRGMSVLTGPI